MVANSLERLIADVMLHFAGVFLRCFRVYAQIHQKIGKRVVPLQHFRRNLHTAVRQSDETVLNRRNIL